MFGEPFVSFQGGGRFTVDGELVIVSQRARHGPHPLEGLTRGGRLQQLVCQVGLVSLASVACRTAEEQKEEDGRGRRSSRNHLQSTSIIDLTVLLSSFAS